MVKPKNVQAKRIMRTIDAQWFGGAMAVEPRYLDGFLSWLEDAVDDDEDPDAELEVDQYVAPQEA